MKRNKSNINTKPRSTDQCKKKKELIAAILDARQLSIIAAGSEEWTCGCAGISDGGG